MQPQGSGAQLPQGRIVVGGQGSGQAILIQTHSGSCSFIELLRRLLRIWLCLGVPMLLKESGAQLLKGGVVVGGHGSRQTLFVRF